LAQNGYKYKPKTISKWLQSQEAYTLHKPVRRKFNRRSTLASGINDQFQADLIDMQKHKNSNSNHGYILTVVDVFSKFSWAKPLKSKSGKEVAQKLGKEFYNTQVKTLLTKFDILHFSSENDDIKGAVVERFNRTLQTRLYRWFTKTQEHNWTNVIEHIVDSYNNTVHSSTKFSPANIDSKNEEDVWLNLYGNLKAPNLLKARLKINDMVRISKYKHVFSKGYIENWSIETFIVSKVLETDPVTYRLKDQQNELIHGSYYEDELQKVMQSDKFTVEKILDQRKVGRKIEYLVKFKGYPAKFNEWISKSNFK